MEKDLDKQFRVCISLFAAGRTEEGLKASEELAKTGYLRMQRALAIGYFYGEEGIQVNYPKALYWFKEMAKTNDGQSFYHLGKMFLEGLGIEVDINKGLEFIQKSADLKYGPGELLLGDFNFYGQYMTVNRELAHQYYLRAFNNGEKYSAHQLGFLHLFEPFVGSDTQYNHSQTYFKFCVDLLNSKSGEVMTSILQNTTSVPNQKKALSLNDLLQKLQEEETPETYYRGQTKYFGNPLCPSIFRFPHSKYPIIYEGEERLRSTGNHFYIHDTFHPKSKGEKVRSLLNSYINLVFGYPLAQALLQQAGYYSEGTDVTKDIKVALFFSTFDYNTTTGTFYIDEQKEYSVIYRWKKLKVEDNVLQKDYYSCGNFIPTKNIFESFSVCETYSQFENSILDYSEAINWGHNFSLDEIRGKRPFHLLKFPKNFLEHSRIYKQNAGLLLPDVVISDYAANFEHYKPPRYLKDLPFRLMQDLSEKDFCEVYIYKRDNELAKSILNSYQIIPKAIYNDEQDDLSHLMLYQWMETRWQRGNFSGINTIDLNLARHSDVNHMEAVLYLIKSREKRNKVGYFFES